VFSKSSCSFVSARPGPFPYTAPTEREPTGKSLPFLYIVLVGYMAGVLHKIFYSFDRVIFLYVVNGLMVGVLTSSSITAMLEG